MGDPAPSRQLFLGIGGQQTGPFTEAEILQQWRAGQIPEDALLWYDGLEDWKPADQVIGALSDAAPVSVPLGNYSRRGQSEEVFSTFASKEEGLNPVFADGEIGASGSFFLRYRLHIFFGTIVLTCFMVAGGLYVYTWIKGPKETVTGVPPAFGKKINPREIEYRRAIADILLNSEQSVASLTKLVKENPNDDIGRQALESAIDYFRRSQRYHDMGRLLLVAKRPSEAIRYFLGENPSYPEALGALEQAFGETRKPEYLVQQIELLLGPLNDVPRAVTQLRKLEADFPNTAHPFAFYLKSVDDQIADLFSRTSFYFVQSLLSFLESELPQVHLTKRPLVALRRDKDDGYRIVGSYEGEITLSRDLLKDVRLVFWFIDDRWIMVETNLTRERAKWASNQRLKRQNDVQTGAQMLASLEQRFRTQFPKAKLHEVVKPTESSAKRAAEE